MHKTYNNMDIIGFYFLNKIIIMSHKVEHSDSTRPGIRKNGKAEIGLPKQRTFLQPDNYF